MILLNVIHDVLLSFCILAPEILTTIVLKVSYFGQLYIFVLILIL